MSNPALLQAFDAFVRSLKDERVGIVFDSDADGLTSGVITWIALERLGITPVWASTQEERGGRLGLDVLQKVQEKELDVLITCDKPIDQDVDRVQQLEEHVRVLVLDHHTVNHDIASDKTLFIKAQFIMDKEGGSQYPTAKLAYDLFSRLVDLSDLDWVAAAGLIADACYRSWKGFVDDILTRWCEPVPEDIFDSKLARVSKFINNILIFDKGLANDIFHELRKAKEVDAFLQSPLTQYEQVVQDEMEYWLYSAPEKVEVHKDLDLIWYDLEPKFRIASPVSTILSMHNYPDKTVVVTQDLGRDDISISLRRQDRKVDMARMARELTSDLENANGGGHAPAAGASVQREDLSTFKERVLHYLSK